MSEKIQGQVMIANTFLFFSSFLLVFLLGIQSKNVNGDHYILAALTSIGVGICNFYVLRNVPLKEIDFWGVIAYLSGGPAGIVISMIVHNKFVKSKQ